MDKRLLFNAFSMNCVSHIQQGLWTREDTRQTEYKSLAPWMELAQILEGGCFDALFLADVVGLYDTYRGGRGRVHPRGHAGAGERPHAADPRHGVGHRAPGLRLHGSILQSHPFTFARQLSTLDHLTNGRVAWNIVTSYLPNAAASLGLHDLPDHDARYDQADEYLDVIYQLCEASWEEDAVLVDRTNRIYADPAKIHPSTTRALLRGGRSPPVRAVTAAHPAAVPGRLLRTWTGASRPATPSACSS